MRCPSCAEQAPDTAKVCGHCGQLLNAAAPPPSERGPPGWLWGAAGALLALIVVGLLLAAGVIVQPGRREARSAPPTYVAVVATVAQPAATLMPTPELNAPTEASQATATGAGPPTETSSPLSSTAFTPDPSCINRFLYRPFAGTFPILNRFDHEYPTQARNGSMVTWWGERSTTIGYDGHPATDWNMPEGTPLLAAADGWIRLAGDEVEPECRGSPPCPSDNVPCTTTVQRVILDTRFHGRDGAWEGYLIGYYHLSRIDAQEGQGVHVGQPIGLSGQTGCAASPHLHLQIWWSDTEGSWSPIDPYGWSGSAEIPLDPWASLPAGAESCYLWAVEP